MFYREAALMLIEKAADSLVDIVRLAQEWNDVKLREDALALYGKALELRPAGSRKCK